VKYKPNDPTVIKLASRSQVSAVSAVLSAGYELEPGQRSWRIVVNGPHSDARAAQSAQCCQQAMRCSQDGVISSIYRALTCGREYRFLSSPKRPNPLRGPPYFLFQQHHRRLPRKQGSKGVTLTTPPCTAEVNEWVYLNSPYACMTRTRTPLTFSPCVSHAEGAGYSAMEANHDVNS
jgi:hypothetical protein